MQTSTRRVIRAADRFHTNLDWLDSWHSFSFGHHFDPDHVGHGLLIVSNDDTVAPGGGFGSHPHRDMEIVTWVLEGALDHSDSAGHDGTLYPGLAQRMSAGRGVLHSEMNHSSTEPVHFVQMWVIPDTEGIEPSYEQADVGAALDAGGLVTVAAGREEDAAVHISQAGAAMSVARLDPGQNVTVPDAPYVHVFIARGAVQTGDDELSAGDALRLTGGGDVTVTATQPAEIIAWASDSTARR